MSLPATPPEHGLFGADVHPIAADTCAALLAWLRTDGPAPALPCEQLSPLSWALAHCDDGVTWGWYDKTAQQWRLSHDVASHISPAVTATNLQELRLFGPSGEVLIFRSEDRLAGRALVEAPLTESDSPYAPLPGPDKTEARVLRGDRVVQSYDRFTHIADAAGAEQVIPIQVTATGSLRQNRVQLLLRHYCQVDEGTGAARVAATRLVDLSVQAPERARG